MEDTNSETTLKSLLVFVQEWIDNNPNTDPNVYELVQLAIAVSKYKSEDGNEIKDINNILNKIWKKRSKDLLNPESELDITEESPLYMTLNEVIDKALGGEEIVTDIYQEELLELACSLSFYMKQRKRNKKRGYVEPFNIDEQLRFMMLQNQVLPRELGENCDKLLEEINEEYILESQEQEKEGIIEEEPKLEENKSEISKVNQLESRLDFVQEWISSNPDTDPNAYELADLCILVSECTSDPSIDQTMTAGIEEKLNKIWEKRSRDFLNRGLGIKTSSPVYKTLVDLKNKALSGEKIVSSKSQEEVIKMTCGVGLYIGQQRRELKNKDAVGEDVYNNTEEISKLDDMYEKNLDNDDKENTNYFKENSDLSESIKGIRDCYNGKEVTDIEKFRRELKEKVIPIERLKYSSKDNNQRQRDEQEKTI